MVHGRKGSFIKYGMDVQENVLIDKKRPPMEDWGKDDPSMYGILTTHVAGQMEQKVIPTVIGNYGKYYDNIYKALTEKAPLMVNPFDTVAVLKIIEAAMESNQSKKRVNV